MIKAEFNENEVSCEMKGDLADVMAEFVCGTLGMMDVIASINEKAALVLRNDLITKLAGYRPTPGSVEAIEKEVEQ